MAFEIFKLKFPRGRYGFLANIKNKEIVHIPGGYDFRLLRKHCLQYMKNHKVILSWEKQEDGSYKIKREE